MKLSFTKMHGAGNDFVVIQALDTPLNLSTEQWRRLGHRQLGIGADQILLVEPAPHKEVDFAYRIFNGATGQEVEHCGNGARCFARFVHEQGLTQRNPVRVQTMNRRLALWTEDDGRVRVDMQAPDLHPHAVGFDTADLSPVPVQAQDVWPLADQHWSLVSMGNPHAVAVVDDVQSAPVNSLGPIIEKHPRFAHGVNVGFMQVLHPHGIALRVFERGAGETLSCGTGACAAVVSGIQMGRLVSPVDVQTPGGLLTVSWDGPGQAVFLTGPAETVFRGEIEL